MGKGNGVLPGGQVSPEALILLNNAYFMAFLADDIPVSALLQIQERVLYDMTRGTKVGIILGILVIAVAVKKKGKYNDGQYEALKIVGNYHSSPYRPQSYLSRITAE